MKFSGLSDREKICQTMIVKADPKKHIKKYGSIRNFLEEYPVGGIFIGIEMFQSGDYDLDGIRKTVREYQKYSKIPLLVAADAENGISYIDPSFTEFPPPMALGSAKDEELAYGFGKAIGDEARSIGINWTFAPVCDLNINRYNEIVGTRSISNDADLASRMLVSEIRGFSDAGILTTGKHFPGDGCDVRNQHIVGSVNGLSRKEWLDSYGKVYKSLFDAGLASVMVGHISVPAFQSDSEGGVYPPATLSRDAISLLKDTLGFKGAAITDAMDMGGFVRYKYSRRDAEVISFGCGMDLMLWPRDETADLIENALKSGEIPKERLDDAICRVEFMKNKLEEFGTNAEFSPTYSEYAKNVSKELSEKAGTLYKNDLGIVPIDRSRVKKVRIITSAECFLDTPEGTRKATLEKARMIAEEFENRGATVDIKQDWDVYLEDYEAGEIDRDYDLILFCTFSNSALPMYSRELVNLHSAGRFDGDKTIVLVFGTPHYISEYFPLSETVIHTYPTRACIENAVGAIYGEKKLTGSLPIK